MNKHPAYNQISDWLKAQEANMVATLKEFVARPSCAREPDSTRAFACWLHGFLQKDGFESKLYDVGNGNGGVIVAEIGRECGGKPILIGGHYDTVLPNVTNFENPFRQEGDNIYGPGTIDMKGGLVLAIYAVRALKAIGCLPYVRFVFDGDEESCHAGSNTPDLVIEHSKGCSVALSVETGRNPVAVGRRGLCRCVIKLTAEAGYNAIELITSRCVGFSELTSKEMGTSANVSIIHATTNHAEITVDLRCTYVSEEKKCVEQLRHLFEGIPGQFITEFSFPNVMPVMEHTKANDKLLDALNEVAALYDLPALKGDFISGSSDAALHTLAGLPTLCGLGSLGEGMHTTHEHCFRSRLVERSLLLAYSILHNQEFRCLE